MIRDYKELKKRSDLKLRFEDYKQDWQRKNEILKGDFIPSVEIYEEEIDLLLRMCEHAILLNRFQTSILSEIEDLKKNLIEKKARHESDVLESIHTILSYEEQLDTILFILEESRKEIIQAKRNKGQVSLF